MAEEIKLSASLKDDVTKSIQKIERSLARLSKSFEKLGVKLRKTNKELGIMAMASERLSKSFRAQTLSMQASMRTMDQYKRSVGQVVNAEQKLNQQIAITNREAAASARRSGAVSGSAGGGMGRYGAIGVGAAAVTLGSQLNSMLMSTGRAILQLAKKMLLAPFTKAMGMIGERVSDEMSDITSAGGMFAIDKKNKPMNRLFKDFAEAREMQRELNAALARSAAALPGETNQYVQAAKMLTDTVMEVSVKDRDGFKDFAKSLGSDGSGKNDITKVLTKFTEQSVLLQMGSGRGGMPLGILLEQLVTMDNVNVQGMRNRYAQLRYNPLLANSLMDAQEAINAQGANTAGRFKAVVDALDKALPKEVVNAMMSSLDGVYQAIKSGFLDPEVGLFGLGRALDNLNFQKYDEFGRKIEGVSVTLSAFEVLRDVIAGFGLPLAEIIAVLPTLYDPLEAIGRAFGRLREVAKNMLFSFNSFTKYFKDLEFEDAGVRGAVSAFNNLLQTVGAIGQDQAILNAEKLVAGDKLGPMLGDMFRQLFNSDFMESIGSAIGTTVASLVGIVGDLLGFATGTNVNRFAAGVKEGFVSAGGPSIFKKFVEDFVNLVFKGLLTVIDNIGTGGKMLAAAVVVGPAIITGLAAIMAAAVPLLISSIGATIPGLVYGLLKLSLGKAYEPKTGTLKNVGIFGGSMASPEAKGAFYRGKSIGDAIRSFFTGGKNIVSQEAADLINRNKGYNPTRMSGDDLVNAMKKPSLNDLDDILKGSKGKPMSMVMAEDLGPILGKKSPFAKAAAKLQGFGKSMAQLKIFGLLSGILYSLDKFLAGDFFGGLANVLTAGLGTVIGTIIGGAIGSLAGPIGTAIGATIGGTIGGMLGDMESVIRPTREALVSIFNTITTAFTLLSEVVMGAFWALDKLVQAIPGVSGEFSVLEAIVFALLSPFRLLELAISGLYLAFLHAKKGLGLGSNEDDAKIKAETRNLADRTSQFTIDGNKAAGMSYAEQMETNKDILERAMSAGKSGIPLAQETNRQQNILRGLVDPDSRKIKPQANATLDQIKPVVNTNNTRNVSVGDINVNMTSSVGGDPKETADLVAKEVMTAIERSSYSELYV